MTAPDVWHWDNFYQRNKIRQLERNEPLSEKTSEWFLVWEPRRSTQSNQLPTVPQHGDITLWRARQVQWQFVWSSVLFGTAHAYQSLPGVWRTMMAGAIAAILYACSGTLWFSIILHVAVDIHGGTIARYALHIVESKVET